MIDYLRSMAVFVKVVEAGSFRAAAKSLNLSPSVVSHHVAQLEDRLSVALLYRSTRKLSLTEDGQRLFEASRNVAEAGLNALFDRTEQPVGRLRIAVTGAVFENPPFFDCLVAFAKAYPRVESSISFSDQKVELIGGVFDAAIRVGWLEDSRYKARKLTEIRHALAAAPTYLIDRAEPSTMTELCELDLIKLAHVSIARQLINASGEAPNLRPRTAVEVDSVAALRRMAVSGMGVAALPRFLVEEDIQAGRLVALSPNWELMALNMYVLWPNNAPREGLTMRFVHLLAQQLSDI